MQNSTTFYAKSSSLSFFFFCWVASFALALAGLSSLDAQDKGVPSSLSLKKGMLMLEIHPVYQNALKPWIWERGKSFSAIGLLVQKKKKAYVLLASRDVRNAKLIEISKYSSYTQKSLARVLHRDREAGLALLDVEEEGFFKDLEALRLGDDPRPGQFVSSVYIDTLFQIYRDRFRIQDIGIISYSGFTYLPYCSFHAAESFPQGGLLFCKSKICGFINYSNNKGYGRAVISSVIKHFLAGFVPNNKSQSSSFAAQGFRLHRLADPATRKYYQLPPQLTGSIVSEVAPGSSAWQVLKEKDILLSIDGVSVNNWGLFRHPFWGPQKAQFLLAMRDGKMRHPGQKVELEVLRNSKKKRLSMKLRSYGGHGERIPEEIENAPYFVENGIVFLELSRALLRSLYGKNWKQKSSLMGHVFQKYRYYKQELKDRIVVLGSILPDPATRGLRPFRGFIAQTINGKDIQNVQALRKEVLGLVQKGEATAKINLYGNIPLYLDLQKRKEMNQRIFKKYSIPRASPWDPKWQESSAAP